MPFSPRQPLPGIRKLGQAGVGVFPEVEEFRVILDRLGFVAGLLEDLPEHVEAPGILLSIEHPADIHLGDIFESLPSFFHITGAEMGQAEMINRPRLVIGNLRLGGPEGERFLDGRDRLAVIPAFELDISLASAADVPASLLFSAP